MFFHVFFLKIVFYFEIWINSNELSHSVDRMLWFVVRCVYFSIWFSRHPLSRLQMQVPLWDNRSGIPARDAWGRFVAERHRVQWPNLTFEMAASVRFSSKRYCRAEIVMFCLFFCIFSRFFFKIFKIFQDCFGKSVYFYFFFFGRGPILSIYFSYFFRGAWNLSIITFVYFVDFFRTRISNPRLRSIVF